MKRCLLSVPLSTFCCTRASHTSPTPWMWGEEGSRAGKVAPGGRVKGLKLSAFLKGVQRMCDGCQLYGSGHKVPPVLEQWCLGGAPGSFGGCRGLQVTWFPKSIADQGSEGVSGNYKCPQITKSAAITAKTGAGLLGLCSWGQSGSHVCWDVRAKPSAPAPHPCCWPQGRLSEGLEQL